jgi:hypothetical protein
MKMGFEGLIYYGAKGSTASTLITNRVDVSCDTDPQMAPTTVCGAGSAPPIESEDVCTVKFSATLKMKNLGTEDTVLVALRTAAACGGQVAIRMKDYASGKGFDGDVNVKEAQGAPIGGEQTFDFTFTPNNKLRAPQLYV